jgi:acyl-CoA thioester hydrolase
MTSPVGRWPIRIYYEDTDHGGAVYYANYLKFFERGRTELLRELGFEQDVLARDQQVLFVVTRVAVDYRRPAVFNDRLLVTTRPGAPGQARVAFEQAIYREGEEAALCEGRIDVACVDPVRQRPARIPADVRAALAGQRE